MQFLHNYVPVRAFTEVATDAWEGFFQVFAQGGGGKYVSIRKACGKLGGSSTLYTKTLCLVVVFFY